MKPVDQQFADQCATTPDATAVVERGRRWTYREVLSRVRRAASALEQEHHLAPGSAVGVDLRPGVDLLTALLAIHWLGHHYCPLPADLPPQGRRTIVADADIALVVSRSQADQHSSDDHLPDLGDDSGVRRLHPASFDTADPFTGPSCSSLSALAYLIYTSGSTGQPKGVEIEHRSLAEFLVSAETFLPLGAAARVLQSTPLSFDIAALEIFLPVLNGGMSLPATPAWPLRPAALSRQIDSQRPSLVQLTPVTLRLLLSAGLDLDASAVLLCGGEQLPSAAATHLAAASFRAFNMYGPTEATIWVTYWEITSGDVELGTAMQHACVHLVDDALQEVRDSGRGEIYLGGPALARGYHHRPTLTAETFVHLDGLCGKSRHYKTGDLGRRVAGRLHWSGRTDTQVKINGNRAELGEIEAVACAVAGVEFAVASASHRGDGTGYLQLWVQSSQPAEPTRAAVKAELAAALPPALLPRDVHVTDRLPTTGNGKIDRVSLQRHASRGNSNGTSAMEATSE